MRSFYRNVYSMGLVSKTRLETKGKQGSSITLSKYRTFATHFNKEKNGPDTKGYFLKAESAVFRRALG